jgi:hypothetical protein
MKYKLHALSKVVVVSLEQVLWSTSDQEEEQE